MGNVDGAHPRGLSRRPRVSVVIPAYYSYATLPECLHALRAQTYRAFETIVVNSSPEETTAGVMRAFPEVRFEQSPVRLYPHAARNCGIVRAEGEILVFTDPDCRARPDWLAHLVGAHDLGHTVVGGSMGLVNPAPHECAIHLCKFSWLLETHAPGPVPVICTANASYARDVFDVIGPFDGNLFIGDAVMSWRASTAGRVPWFEPRAVVDHHHDGERAGYVREFRSRGAEYGAARIAFHAWGRGRALAHAALWPALAAVELARSGRHAVRRGWGRRYLRTLPMQTAMKVAWARGEAKAYLAFALSGKNPAKLRPAKS